MKRRQLLGAAGAGLALSLWPQWLREAFGDGETCDPAGGTPDTPARRAQAVARAFQRAQQAGKPLLVLVIPASDDGKYDRGRSFGELINFGADRDLAPLSRAEVVCATMADLRRIVPTAGSGEPLMVLVQTGSVPASARALDAALPASEEDRRRGDSRSWEEIEKAEDAESDKRIAVLGNLLRGALGDPAPAGKLAAEVRQRIRDKPPGGAHWARSSGCGTYVEGVEDNAAYGCGMGHVPRKGRRFLYFFSARERRL